MSKSIKSQKDILSKLGIEQLNPMQQETQKAMESSKEIVVLSPTGTGKTLAFLLPIIDALDTECEEIQAVIIVPSRELAIQIEQVMREMGAGFKVNAVYGGRSGSKDRVEIKHRPAVLIGTPGRVADHLRREAFSTEFIKTLVLDEFDKSLQVGFETEMKEIVNKLSGVHKKILTSATQSVEIPNFVRMPHPVVVDYLEEGTNKLEIKKVVALKGKKLDALVDLIAHVGVSNGIIFCNLKDTIQEVSDHLRANNISHGTFYGGMEQVDRERALIKFRNGTHQILLATDLAARGIDVPELDYIVHYQVPFKEDEFTHRNGRTARMHSKGTAYVLLEETERSPDYIKDIATVRIGRAELVKAPQWTTLFVSGGRKDKISKGDIAGLFFKQGNLVKEELGMIELKTDCAFVAVKKETIKKLLPLVNNMRLKKKKVRVTVVQ